MLGHNLLKRELALKTKIEKIRSTFDEKEATNKLMEVLSSTRLIPVSREDLERSTGKPFDVKMETRGDKTRLTTSIGSVEVSPFMFDRLTALYYLNSPGHTLVSPLLYQDLVRSVYLLLYRYSYVDPGLTRQGYLSPLGFRAIEEALGPIDVEGFASAVNATVPTFGSLCEDVEAPFGSQGSFFELKWRKEYKVVEVNPPRIGPITSEAIKACIELLAAEELPEGRVFITFTPVVWPDITELITESGYVLWHNVPGRGELSPYVDPVTGMALEYAMPRVSVLSRSESLMMKADKGVQVLGEIFGRTRVIGK